jgi:tRNA A-37 threonylcarbamoyl transferase component Bud32
MAELLSRRACERYSRAGFGNRVVVFDERSCVHKDTADFVERIDTLMEQGRILKKGDTSDVSCVTWHNTDIVVKRYNNRGIVHSLRHAIKGSRARRSRRNAMRLIAIGIRTPIPLAYIEQRKGPLPEKSYLVTEYVHGRNLHVLLHDETVAAEQKKEVLREVSELLNELGRHHITHGDLKHTNILITETGPVLTDLDAMRFHKCEALFRIKRARDIGRFLRKTDAAEHLQEYARSLLGASPGPSVNPDCGFERVRSSGWLGWIHRDYPVQALWKLISEKDLRSPGREQIVPVASSDTASVFRCTLATGAGENVVYLKQYHSRSIFDFVKHLFRFSRAKRAFNASLMLQRHGFDTAALVALFEKRVGPVVLENVLLTEEICDGRPLHKCIVQPGGRSDTQTLQEKRSLITAFGRTVGRMHAEGIFHGDLRLGNVLVRKDADCRRFFFIDNERTKKFFRLPKRLRFKNLVQVNMVIDGVSKTDRMRFFRSYLKDNEPIRCGYKRIARKVAVRTYLRLRAKHPHLAARATV